MKLQTHVLASLSIAFLAFFGAPRAADASPFEVGEFVRIYDPSVGESQPWYINDHCFIYGPDNQWHLFGITRQEPMSPADEDNFAHAVSSDLYTKSGWVKKPFALSTDTAAGEAHLWAPYVIEHEGLYYMYYCAGGKTSHEYQLKLATSKDLYTWQRHPANPMFVDGFDARDPFILRIADKWIMYYTATSKPEGGHHVVCAIESADLIHWGGRRVVFTDPSIGTWAGPTESPFVVHRGGSYYLFIGPRNGYRGTCVYRSSDPFSWTIEQQVGKIDSHAAEVILDRDGKWYVSHCGWGQGGVYLAPLTWKDDVGNKNNESIIEKPIVQTGEFFKIYDPADGASKWWINDHCFARGTDGTWHLFGITDEKAAGADPLPQSDFLAHATSMTLARTAWQKQPFPLQADKSLGEVHIWAPHVVRHAGLYYMFYCAGDPDHTKYRIHLATSSDLNNWQRHPANPMVIDGFDGRDPFVWRDGNQWIMYYTATSDPSGGHHTVEAVVSDDLIHWSGKRRVYTDPGTGTWGGDTESPFVIRRGGLYYLFIGPGADYVTTKVFRSDSPFQWTPDQQIAVLKTHAAEVVRDVDGTWYISHCGIDRGGVYLAPLVWNDGADCLETSLPPADGIQQSDLSDKIEKSRLTIDVYRDKMIAGWLGQMVGVAWGYPVEFKYQGQMIPAADVPQWKPDMINHSFEQDDLYVEMTFLKSLQDYGLDVSARQAGLDFANSLYPLWHANEAGRNNLRRGIAPPDSGHPRFNAHADDIDYQIEADFAGLISPLLPNEAIRLGNTFGRIMNYGDGLYGGHFVSAMYSLAFNESRPKHLISQALNYIPAESRYAEAIRDVLACHQQYPDDWTKTWDLINLKYHLNQNYRSFSCDKGKFNIDAKINGAYLAMGLLYGEGDIEKTIQIAMRCGQDADCNASSAAGILFTTIGYQKLPEVYKAFDKTKVFIHTPYNLPDLFAVCQDLAQDAVLRGGGRMVEENEGRVMMIPKEAARPNRIERCFDAGPVANSRFTPRDLDLIKPELRPDNSASKAGAAEPLPVKYESLFTSFVSVQSDQLIDENGPMRFVSFNIPNLHYNEDNMAFEQTNAWSLPDEFEIGDALEAVKQAGGQVVRIYTLSLKGQDDHPDIIRHITAPGQFNEKAFVALDRVLAIANQKGIRVIIPFIDNWKWWGGIPAVAAFRNKQPADFWTNEQLFEDYKEIVRFVINRTNTITGIPYREDKAIFAWETGNELESPDVWTAKAAAFIKSLDSNHLLIDGFHTPVLKDGSLLDPNIDIVTTHHYSTNPAQTIAQIQQNAEKSRGQKPYFVGEFGFVPTSGVGRIIDAVINNKVAGALVWSLRFRCRDGGFYWHSEPLGGDLFKAYHWPGFDSGRVYDEIALFELMRQKAFQIRGLAVPPLAIPASPRLLPVTDNAAISWQGSAGAQHYVVERAEKSDGPWRVIAENVSDASYQHRPLFADSSAVIGNSYYYRVCAKNSAGVSEPSNAEGPIKAIYHAIVDEMEDMRHLAAYRGKFSLEVKEARKFKEDVHRLKGHRGSYVIYVMDEPIRSFKVYSFFEETVRHFLISASSNGKTYEPISCETIDYSAGKDSYDYHVPVLYQAWMPLKSDYRYLKIEYTDTAQISRVELKKGKHKTDLGSKKSGPGFVKGFSWGWPGTRDQYLGDEPAESMNKLAQTGSEWVCIAFAAEMDTFDNPHFAFSDANTRMVTDAEVKRAIQLARDNHLKIILKPVINVQDGTWRAWIKFTDAEGNKDLAAWNIWWSNFRQFVLHYAAMAQDAGCEMLCLGCEMESTEEFENRWRNLIADVRGIYSGPITYNANHGREDKIPWFDALDIISISAYYPVGTDDVMEAEAAGLHNLPVSSNTLTALKNRWEPIRLQLKDISRRFDRPILFIELGVCNAKGATAAPWTHEDPNMVYDASEQARYYQSAFETFWNEKWFMGFTWWEWPVRLYDPKDAATDVGFSIYAKSAQDIVRQWYTKKR